MKMATTRAKSLARFRGTPKTQPKFIEPTDDDVAKDELEKDESKWFGVYMVDKVQPKIMSFSKQLSFNFTPTPVKQSCLQEKDKFKTKMNLESLEARYHPIENVDVPKGEISSNGGTPVNYQAPEKQILKYTVVTKYMNLPNKSGIGYQLSNGDIGILCQNGDKLLLKPKFDKLFYFDSFDILMHSTQYSSLTSNQTALKRTKTCTSEYKGKVSPPKNYRMRLSIRRMLLPTPTPNPKQTKIPNPHLAYLPIPAQPTQLHPQTAALPPHLRMLEILIHCPLPEHSCVH